MTNIRVETDADGIVTLTWDMPGRSMNVLSEDSISEYVAAADKAIADPSVKGVVVTSAKPAFIAGADLSMLQKQTSAHPGPARRKEQTAKAIFDNLMQFNLALRRIEKGGKPFVAAINGLALGGGLEVCLACHHRVVANDPRIQLGLVESKVGLMPGAGGTQRMPRLMGAMAALPMMLEGKTIGPDAALKGGLVHKVVPAADLIKEAKAIIKAGGKAVQPWDEKGFKIPGGDPYHPAASQVFVAGNAMLHAKTMGNYPAPEAIMSAVYEGLLVPIDAGAAHRGALHDQGHDAPGLAQHDPLALHQHAEGQQAGAPAQGRAEDQARQDRRAGRRHDGRRHRLRVGARPASTWC